MPIWASQAYNNFVTQHERSDVANWVSGKFTDFSSHGGMRKVLPPIGEGLVVQEILDSERSVVVNLALATLSPMDARLLGHLIASLVIDAALARPTIQRSALSLYVDEAQILPAASLARALAQGRKFGLSLGVAYQHRAQLDPLLLGALGNAKATFVFRVGPEDAAYFAPQVGLPASRLVSTSELNAYAKLQVRGSVLAPFTLSLDPPEPLEEPADAYNGPAMGGRPT